MLDTFSWSDLAGFWGAFLSTALALSSAWPVFHVEPSDDPTAELIIRVVNPKGKMIFVREWKRFPVGANRFPLGVFTDKSKLIEIGEPGKLWISVKAGDEKLVKVDWHSAGEGPIEAAWLLVFLWRGPWLLPIEVPAVVFVSTKLADRMKAAN